MDITAEVILAQQIAGLSLEKARLLVKISQLEQELQRYANKSDSVSRERVSDRRVPGRSVHGERPGNGHVDRGSSGGEGLECANGAVQDLDQTVGGDEGVDSAGNA